MPKSPRFCLYKKIKVINDARVIMVFNIKSKNLVQFEQITKVENIS